MDNLYFIKEDNIKYIEKSCSKFHMFKVYFIPMMEKLVKTWEPRKIVLSKITY